MKIHVVIAAVLGLALGTVLIGYIGFRPVLGAVQAIGWPGFVVFTLYWPLVMVVLGLAWWVVAPGLAPDRIPVFVWGRLLREAASDILPFSQLGGLLIGTRAVIALGIGETLVFAATVIDLTTELWAQLVYALTGVGVLAWRLADGSSSRSLLWVAVGGLALAGLVTGGFVLVQRRGLAMITWLAQHWFPETIARAEAVYAELDRIYRNPRRLAAGVALNGIGWVASGFGSWIALEFMDAHVPLWAILVTESLMYSVRSAAFFVPGALGVQEGAYVLIGPLFGLHPDIALGLSLLKRGRDLAIGIPTLIAWQTMEGHRLLARRIEPLAPPKA